MERLARTYALARIGLAAAVAVAPTRSTRLWIGDVAEHPDVHGPLWSLAIRDALLGVAALRDRRALWLCATADAVDAVVCGRDFARTRRPGAAVMALAAAGGAALGTRTAKALT